MEYRVRAHNTAVNSANRMHADDTARKYGFRGGLVPGVDVYAYVTHLPVMTWGMDWLSRGTMTARFLQPVYDEDDVVVTAVPGALSDELILELHDSAGDLCASAEASLPAATSTPPPLDAVPTRESAADRPRASSASLAPGVVLGSLDVGFHAENADDYLRDVREGGALYRDSGVAHPGWLLRFANSILAANVTLGPWIHVSSAVTNFAVVHDGQRVATRARVVDEYDRKGHRFVELDVLLVADGTEPVMRVHHRAIYEPRRRD